MDVLIIGAGQSGLAVAFYLRRTKLSFRLLDRQEAPGGAWQHTWNSLRLFSPARFSSLPGRIMEGGPDHYPTRDEAIAKVVTLVLSPGGKLASQIAGPGARLASIVKAIEEKLEKGEAIAKAG